MKLKYTANALRRLRQIMDFNGGRKGKKIATDILDRADELQNYPELGPEEDNLKHLGHHIIRIFPNVEDINDNNEWFGDQVNDLVQRSYQ